ncbi:hypothetical protein [Desulfolutivibrio sulfoxidireducens]|uniref:hypothetical protein n=1 Tax=Desulfolutivibrio sulfoxidireducens TaxID=2773299 RepID=UPI00159D9A1A|nr:hypothetical protein [Desulfolutivibrio sulfoxidireducens]QLA17854.1 hypothetical protein GD605_18080 [Desulfolutivibrio sulfoxidireducens]QLA21434.1 hypothetical protein GD604_17710 [Desulfolutivibrio sulfoxidireducens]
MTGRALVARTAIGLACLAGVVAGLLLWFGAWYFPAWRLEGFSKNQYLQAAELAARGLAHAEGLTFMDFDFLKYREVTRGSEAYVWGAARCRAPDGGTELAWIYLEWSAKRKQWLRNYSLLLATPDDEIFYTRTHPGQARRARLAIDKLLHQLARNVREVRDPPPGG